MSQRVGKNPYFRSHLNILKQKLGKQLKKTDNQLIEIGKF